MKLVAMLANVTIKFFLDTLYIQKYYLTILILGVKSLIISRSLFSINCQVILSDIVSHKNLTLHYLILQFNLINFTIYDNIKIKTKNTK